MSYIITIKGVEYIATTSEAEDYKGRVFQKLMKLEKVQDHIDQKVWAFKP